MTEGNLEKRIADLSKALPNECKKRWSVTQGNPLPAIVDQLPQNLGEALSWQLLADLVSDGNMERVTVSLSGKCGDCVHRLEGGICQAYEKIILPLSSGSARN